MLENVEVRGNFRTASSGPQLDATIRSTGGSLRDVAYRTLDAQASLRNQKLTFERLTLSAFDGSIAGAGSYDMAKPNEPAFAFRGKVDGVDVSKLLAQLGAGRALQMTGRLHANLDLDGRGSEWEVIRPRADREWLRSKSWMGCSRASTSPKAFSAASPGSRDSAI